MKEIVLTQEAPSGLGRKTAAVMVLTLLSRISGFLRDAFLAHIFGASGIFDAFVVAFRIPNLMRRLFGEGAFAQTLVPVLTEYRIHRSFNESQLLVNQLAGFFTFFSLILVIIGEILAPLVVLLLSPGFFHDPERYHLAVQLIRITQPYLFFISLTSLAGAILNSYHRFTLTAFTPVILNITLIFIAYYSSLEADLLNKINYLAFGVCLSGLIQLGIQIPALAQLKLLPTLTWRCYEPRIKIIFKQFFPALLSVSLLQVSLLIDNLFASYLPAGSISWLYYSDRLIYLPLGIIGVALAVVAMPHLSHFHQSNAKKDFSSTLDWTLRCTLVMAAPAAAGLWILADPILEVLMHHGAFTHHDVLMTGQSLRAFALGLPAWMLIKVLASAFYSQQNIKTPLKIFGIAITTNILLNFIFMHPLGHTGLALATTLASWLNAMLLWFFSARKQNIHHQRKWLRLVLGIFVGVLVMSGFLTWGKSRLSPESTWNSMTGFEHLAILIGIGGLLYFAGLMFMGIRRRHFSPPKL